MKLNFVTVVVAVTAALGCPTTKPETKPKFVHPGLLHTNSDFARVQRLVNSTGPWATGFAKLKARANLDREPKARASICRGINAGCTQNYPDLYRDAAAAYANAIYWRITGDVAYAESAGATLDAWSSTLKEIIGSSDKFLASGLYGYQLANAAEILRDYKPWKGLNEVINLLYTVFYPMNRLFLDEHNGNPVDHYWANWDLANLCTLHATGVLADNATTVAEAVDYFKTGWGMGAINNAIWHIHKENGTNKALGQGQEAGRDQGHALLDFGLLGTLAQQNYNQGEDLFAYGNNRILAGAEYVFKYNVGKEVPFKTYTNVHGTATVVSPVARGELRPIAEILYAHYAGVKGLDASWTRQYRDLVVENGSGAEGGGGDYGPNSGGYDQLGFGTLLYRLDR
ncbi:GPI secreted protein [Paramyrothecium foliicola]|nr:GPI secreted protein [Paramyrothecium foliicola]